MQILCKALLKKIIKNKVMRNLNVRKQTSTMVENNSAELNSRLIKVKGFNITLPIGSSDKEITLPAEASQLLGIAFDQNFNADFSLQVNNEIVHEKIASIFATVNPNGALGLQPYFPVNRSLRGRDDVRISINSQVNATVNLAIYYK